MEEKFKTKSEYLDFVEQKFKDCFSSKDYIEEQPVNITSQVDKTVDFIGSKISPLKKYVLTEDFGENGRKQYEIKIITVFERNYTTKIWLLL